MNIRIEDLFYIYESDNEPVVALRGLHLEVRSGECLVVKGPNGSGKSTLVKLLTGFFTPTAGRIFIGDRNISHVDPLQLRREFVSSIDQKGNLLGDITVIENITLPYALVGHSRSSAREQAKNLLEMHNLAYLSDRFPAQLSAGERQFSSLLAAIATSPKVLIADEPSGELDNLTAEIMYKLLRSLAKTASVILVTHDARAENYADRIVQIQEGRISESWLPRKKETSVIDPFGWMRVREISSPAPRHRVQSEALNRQSLIRGTDLGLSYDGKEIFSGLEILGTNGELIALSSPSGSGKSSLLRILCGIQEPTKGEVHVLGRSLQDLTREERAELRRGSIGYLGQGSGALANISLADHVGSLLANLEDTYGDRMGRPLSTFSGGERARIELLKILAEGNSILLLDEPTSQMDERRRLEAGHLILDFVDDGGLVITSTRDPYLLANAARVLSVQ